MSFIGGKGPSEILRTHLKNSLSCLYCTGIDPRSLRGIIHRESASPQSNPPIPCGETKNESTIPCYFHRSFPVDELWKTSGSFSHLSFQKRTHRLSALSYRRCPQNHRFDFSLVKQKIVTLHIFHSPYCYYYYLLIYIYLSYLFRAREESPVSPPRYDKGDSL